MGAILLFVCSLIYLFARLFVLFFVFACLAQEKISKNNYNWIKII